MVLLTAAALGAAGCGAPAGQTGPVERRPEVVATVADTAITADQVRALLPAADDGPLVRVAGHAAPDPARQALDRAVRDELLAREATRRGLTGERTDRIAALVRQESAGRPGASAGAITDVAARAWHAAHRAVFDPVKEADVAWAEITDEAVALDLLGRAAGVDERRFLQLVRSWTGAGVDRAGADRIDHDGRGAAGLVTRAAYAVRTAGGVGLAEESGSLAEKPGTRRWWLVRVERIEFEAVRWSPPLAQRVRAAMAWQHQQDHLDKLARSLRQAWPVRVYEDRLDALGP